MSELPDRLAHPALAALWARCWRSMARAGETDWPNVTISLPVDDADQRRAVSGLLGRPIRPGAKRTSISLGHLDEVLRRAGDDWDLRRTVETAGGPLPDRVGDAQARLAAVDDARVAARSQLEDEPWVEAWLEELDAGMVTRLYSRGELSLLVRAAELLAALPADGAPLAAFASRTTGDPKALDGTVLSQLVLRGLAHRLGEARPSTAAERRMLWETVGVVPDDLASQVLVLNLDVQDGPLGRWLAEARTHGLPFRLTLHQLRRHPVTIRQPQPVFVCENPAVLRAAAEELGPLSSPLVCTEGRPSMAASLLLRTLAVSGCPIRYHGDFDWPGLHIADSVIAATDGEPWRYATADYREALLDAGAPHRRPLRGARTASPWDPGLAAAMQEHGVVVYEEDVLPALLADLRPTR